MASRFACFATARRRRLLSGSLGSSPARRRRAMAALRRASAVWADSQRGIAPPDDADGRVDVRDAASTPLPTIHSRR
jgi:hypothetical protein